MSPLNAQQMTARFVQWRGQTEAWGHETLYRALLAIEPPVPSAGRQQILRDDAKLRAMRAGDPVLETAARFLLDLTAGMPAGVLVDWLWIWDRDYVVRILEVCDRILDRRAGAVCAAPLMMCPDGCECGRCVPVREEVE